MAYPRAFGNQIRKWRRDHDVLLIEMARAINIGIAQLSSFETGRRPWPTAVKRKAVVWMGRQRTMRRSLKDILLSRPANIRARRRALEDLRTQYTKEH